MLGSLQGEQIQTGISSHQALPNSPLSLSLDVQLGLQHPVETSGAALSHGAPGADALTSSHASESDEWICIGDVSLTGQLFHSTSKFETRHCHIPWSGIAAISKQQTTNSV